MIDFDDIEEQEVRCAEAGERELELPGRPLYVVAHERVMVRAAPNLQAAVLGVKLEGDTVAAAACRGPWIRLAMRSPSQEAWMLCSGEAAGLPGVQLLVRVPEAYEAERRLALRLSGTQQLVQRRRLRWARKGFFGAPVQETVHIGSMACGVEARYASAGDGSSRSASSSGNVWRSPRWTLHAARDFETGELVERCELIPLKCEMAFAQRGRMLTAFDHALLWQRRDGHPSTALFPLGFALLYRLVSTSENPSLDARWSHDGQAVLLSAGRCLRPGEELTLPLALREELLRSVRSRVEGPPEPSRAGGPAGAHQSGRATRREDAPALGQAEKLYRELLQTRLGLGATAGAVRAGPSATHGRGVFALRHFPRSSLVELCPTLEVDEVGREALIDFVMSFETAGPGASAGGGIDSVRLTVAALGLGMVYNHREHPNVSWSYMPGAGGGLVVITALRAIEEGEEMFINYGKNYWASNMEDKGHAGPSVVPNGHEASSLYSIAGTWNDYKPEPMAFNGSWYTQSIVVGETGRESFQILLRGSWQSTIYPSVADASPFVEHELRGPDDSGHGLNWTLGAGAQDPAEPGTCYDVMLVVDGREAARAVTWSRHSAGAKPARPRVALADAAADMRRRELGILGS